MSKGKNGLDRFTRIKNLEKRVEVLAEINELFLEFLQTLDTTIKELKTKTLTEMIKWSEKQNNNEENK